MVTDLWHYLACTSRETLQTQYAKLLTVRLFLKIIWDATRNSYNAKEWFSQTDNSVLKNLILCFTYHFDFQISCSLPRWLFHMYQIHSPDVLDQNKLCLLGSHDWYLKKYQKNIVEHFDLLWYYTRNASNFFPFSKYTLIISISMESLMSANFDTNIHVVCIAHTMVCFV